MVRNADSRRDGQPSRLALAALLVVYAAALLAAWQPLDEQAPRAAAWWQRHAALTEQQAGWWQSSTQLASGSQSWWQHHRQLKAAGEASQSAGIAVADTPWWQHHDRSAAQVAVAATRWWEEHAVSRPSLSRLATVEPWWQRHGTHLASHGGWWRHHRHAGAKVQVAVAARRWWEEHAVSRPGPGRLASVGPWWQQHAPAPAAAPIVVADVTGEDQTGNAAPTAAAADTDTDGEAIKPEKAAPAPAAPTITAEVPKPPVAPVIASIGGGVIPAVNRLLALARHSHGGDAAAIDTASANAEDGSPQCVARDIAGWSGEKLDDERKALLEQVAQLQPVSASADDPESDISAELSARLQQRGFEPGAAVYLRIFKDTSTLEVWLKRGETFALFQKYDICRWSGTFGPKLFEGDRQSPEGYYVVNDQLFNRRSWKWKNSFTINYPNTYDKLHGRTGSLILVHGGCTSSGCFAMTNPVIEEVHDLAAAAWEEGQDLLHVSVYPFPLSEQNLKLYADSPWSDFWRNLKEGYDLFETTRLPPKVRVCDMRYEFAAGDSEDADSADAFDAGCRNLVANVPGWRQAPSRRLSRRDARNARLRATAGNLGCNVGRASCRKWLAMRNRSATRQRAARGKGRMRRAYGIGKRR